MAFCKEYNAQTAKMAGDVVPVEITVYEVSFELGLQCAIVNCLLGEQSRVEGFASALRSFVHVVHQ
jgi:large subunit ribosomal protein L11